MQKKQFEQFSDLLDRHLSTPGYSLTDICRDLGMSRPQLSRLVKDQTGLTLSLYVRRVRLERARELLQNTGLRIVEIADAVGIDSPQTFSKYFAQEFGISPTEYRRQQLPVEEPATAAAPPESALEVPSEAETNPPAHEPEVRPNPRRPWQWALGGLVVLILVVSLFAYLRSMAEKKESFDASIAILPFTYRGDPADSLLAGGLYDQVHASLASIEQLTVISKISSGFFLNSPKAPSQIARELGVRYLLTGRVVAQSRHIQVSVELVEAEKNRTVWARTFEGGLAKGVGFMNIVARQIATELDGELSAGASKRIDRLPTRNVRAYNEYLQGAHLLKSRNLTKMQTALGYFDRALVLDPAFADALAHKGMTYYLLGSDGHIEFQESIELAEKNALAAIRLDETNALAYATLANCYRLLNKYEQALTTYEIALQHSPNDALINYWYSLSLRSLGRFDEAIRYGSRALELDPLYPTIIAGHVGNYSYAGRFEEAWTLIQKSEPLMDRYYMYYYVRAFYYLNRNDTQQALREFVRSNQLEPDNRPITIFILYCRAQLGERAPAEAALRELTDVPDHYVYKATLHAGLRDKENCLRYLQLGAPLGIAPEYLKISPLYRFLHGDPRFEAVLRQLGLSGSV